jgi:PAS domain S-box-containing protein
VWTCDAAGACDFLNQRWLDYTGVPAEKQFGQGWLDQVHADDRGPLALAWKGAVASGADFQVDFRLRRRDGVYRWFDTRAICIRDQGQRPARWFGSNTDIHEEYELRDTLHRQTEQITELNATLETRIVARTEELSRANERAERAVEFVRALTDQLPGMVAYWDSALRCKFANRSYREWFGKSPDEIIGARLRDLLGEGLYAKNEPYILGALAGKPQQFEREVRNKLGEPRHTLAQCIPHVEGGHVEGVVVLITDITARKDAERAVDDLNATLEERVRERTAALSASEERFTTAFRLGPAGLLMTRIRDLVNVEVNDRLLAISGHDRADVVGKSADGLRVITEERAVAVRAQIAAHGGSLRDYELVLTRKNGSTCNVLASTETLDIENDPHRLTMFIDITARKEAERRLSTQYAVSRALADATSLADAAPRVLREICEGEEWDFGALWVVKPDATALRCAGLWHRVELRAEWLANETRIAEFPIALGTPGKAWATKGAVPVHAIPNDGSFLRAAAAADAGLGYSMAFPILHAGEVVAVVDLLTSRARPADALPGELVGAMGQQIGQFIERMRAEEARRASENEVRKLNAELEDRVRRRTAELEAANKELESFSYSVSHDLRAPLRAVNGFAEIVLEDYGAVLPPEGHRLLETIRESGRRMGDLIDDLLGFSRLGRHTLKARRVDVDGLVRAVVEELRPAKKGTLEVRFGELAPCVADPSLLRQVWVNLISNAFKYSRDREHAVVEIGSEAAGDDSAYFIRDNGVGFDMKYAHKLFGAFTRLHRDDEFEGTGIGLAIVQRIVHRHGGRVWADAALDRGATFFFTVYEGTGK